MKVSFLSVVFAVLLLMPMARGYDVATYSGQPVTWNTGSINMQIQLGSSPVLNDGFNYNTSVQAAMDSWNLVLGTVQFVSHTASPSTPSDNSTNEIGFGSTVYGMAFDANVLAVTRSFFSTTPRSDGTYQRSKADIVFNSAYTWDSYRGPLHYAPEIEIRRVALHELGHVLGLNHPDEASPPQIVTAIMNSEIGNLGELTDDDIAGAQSLYGVPNSAPLIVNQPYNQTVFAGGVASFTISAVGKPAPSYQWQRLPGGVGTWTNLSDGAGYAGTGTATLTIPSAALAMNGDNLRCVATNVVGSAISSSVLLTINPAPTLPVVLEQPVGQTVLVGTAASFRVNAAALPLNFQWKKNGVPISTGGRISGTSTDTLRIIDAQTGDGGSYTVVVSNEAGQVTSNAAILAVASAPGGITGGGASNWGFVLRDGGVLCGMGDDSFGQLGIGTTPSQLSLSQVATNVVAVANSQGMHSLFITKDKVLWGMGANDYGQLGAGVTASRTTPTPLDTDVVAASAGIGATLYIKTDGTLWGMGRNDGGELGDGTTINRYAPILIATRVRAVATGGYCTLFIKFDGTLWGMGFNEYGQLGDGSNLNRNVPVQIAAGVSAVAASGFHSLFIKLDGTLYAMGRNDSGVLGDGTIITRFTPVQVASGVKSVATGSSHSLFVKTDGTLWAMGGNYIGQLGDGSTTTRLTPVQVATAVVTSIAGGDYSMFIKTDGSVWVVGNNNNGQIGTGSALGIPAQLLSGTVAVPDVPAGFLMRASTAGSGIFISWNFSLNASEYEVWRNTSSSAGTAIRIAANLSVPSFYDLTAVAGTPYYYWIKSVNQAGASGLSDTVVGTAKAIEQPANQTARSGQTATFVFGAVGNNYQWQRRAGGIGSWIALNNSGGYSGTNTATLLIANAALVMSGDQFRCVVTVAAGYITSDAATLTVLASGSDFNGDGQNDILWQNSSTGERFVWAMNGTSHVGGASLGVVVPEWSIAATADFNDDGQTDILWQNTRTGERYIWFMSGTGHVGGASLGVVATAWSIVGTADFNGDGQTDILWQNTVTGERYIWLMRGAGHLGDVSLGIVSTQWSIAALADFNGDGQADFLWQNTITGERYLWFMSGAGHLSDLGLGIIPTQWSIANAADFNGDGHPDILWQNTVTGQRYLWLMNGTAHQSDVDLGFVDPNWAIVR